MAQAAVLKKGLTDRSISAAMWGVAGSGLRVILQLAVQVFLARTLGPVEYGVFAIGVLVVTLANYFGDVGIAYGLVQKAEVSELDIRFVVTWQLLLGLVTGAVVFAVAGPIAELLHEPRSRGVVQALALVCLLNALSTPALCLLKRRLDYRSLQLAQLGAYVVGYLFVGIPAALAAAGVWSLVYAWLVLAAVQLALLYAVVRHSLVPLLWHKGAGGQLRFGAAVLLANLVNWFMANVDKVVAARVFPGAPLGLYSTSFTLLNTPATVLYSNLQSVVFSAAARVQHRPEAIGRAYLKLVALLLGLSLPFFGALAAVSETLVQTLYGSQWAAAAPLLTAFACGMPLLLIWGVSTPVLWNTGQAWRESAIQLPLGLLWLGGAYLAAQHSLQWLAWGLTLCMLLRVAVISVYVTRTLQISKAEMLGAVRGPLLLMVATVGCAIAVDRALQTTGMPAAAVLALDTLACTVVLTGLLRYCQATLSEPARALIIETSGRLPAPVRAVVVSIARGPQD